MTVELATILLAAALSTAPGAPPPLVDLPYVASAMCAEAGVDVGRCLATIERESGWDPSAVGDRGDAVGIVQFHADATYGTWGYCVARWGRPEWLDPDMREDAVVSLYLFSRAAGAGYGHWWAGWRVS